MKRLFWTALLALGCMNAPAAIYGSHGGGYWHGGHHSRSSFSFSFGVPYYSYYPSYYPSGYAYPYRYSYSYPGYAYSYAPAYAYSYPSYGYSAPYAYGYSRPNYAVGGTLLGALVGGLIGDANHRHGWEGAGIGAAAGLVLGGLAEHNARLQERNYDSAPTVYARPNNTIPDAPAVNTAPTVPDAPSLSSQPASYRPASAMSGANRLFGR